LVALWLIGPIVWVVVVSTQGRLIQDAPPRLAAPTLAAYERLIANPEWQAAATVSISVTVLATAIALGVAVLAAYPLARYRLRGGRSLLLFLLGTQLIPPIAVAIPILFLFAGLGFRNTIAGLVLVNVCFWTPVLVWLVRSAFLGVPANLERAARIDGSSRLGAIFRITLPAAAPAVAAAAAIVFVGIWNDFVFVATLGGRDTYTLPRFLGTSFTPSYSGLAAAIVLTVGPCIALIVMLRRRILQLV
jgi:multiple sugar transport system permease protein